MLVAVEAHAQVAPDRTWRTVETKHVRITYPAPHDSLGARAARFAERAWLELSARLNDPPGAEVELVVSDDIDVANGYAFVAPYPGIVVYAHPPFGDLDILEYSDWFDVVISHEMAHVFHLDEARGVGGALRRVFGRVPAWGWPLFPHVTTPRWTIEGLAVRYETALTGSGRLAGTATDMAVRAAALEDEIPELGLVSGDPVIWPAGSTPYVFGGEFLGWLATRHGDEAFGRYVAALAGDPLPFRIDRAAERASGVEFSDAWETWRAETTARYRIVADSLTRFEPVTRPERLTHQAYWTLAPRWSPDSRAIGYVGYNGRRDVRLIRIDPSSGAEIASTRVPRLGVVAWRSDGSVIVDGYSWEGPHRRWDDLWIVSPEGTSRPLTKGARLSHPDVASSGAVVAVQSEAGTNRLVVLEPDGDSPRAITPLDPGVHWAWPRWSPDESRIAVSRWRGAGFDIVILDARGELEREIAGDGALNLAPAWSPDGDWLLFGSDRTGIANLYAFDLVGNRGLRQVTNVVGGAFFPDVAPDGRWIAHAGYHHDGWAIERMEFDPAAWFDPLPSRDLRAGLASRRGDPAERLSPVDVTEPRPYSPWPTLLPRYWLPIVEAGEEVRDRTLLGVGVGVTTTAFDPVGRHAYAVAATADVEHGRVEAALQYRNSTLGRPTLDLAATQSWEFAGFALPASDGAEQTQGDTLFVLERDREIAFFVTFPFRHPYRTATIAGGAGLLEERRVLLEADLTESDRFRLDEPSVVLPQVFGSASFSTARTFAFSISPENGVSAFARGESRFDPGGRGRTRREATVEIAGYRALGQPWGFARTIAALRWSGGVVRGPGAGDGHFALGGTSGAGLDVSGVVGTRFLFAVRGYDRGERRGRTAWSANAELRFPVALLQKGWGLKPLFLDRLAGSLFLDAGDAWDPCRAQGPCSERLDPLVSTGAELALDVTAFYRVPLVLRFGAARALVDPRSTTAYVAVGRAF
jgi:Tol biopolymer transport system component